jgi:hypothetical protein
MHFVLVVTYILIIKLDTNNAHTPFLSNTKMGTSVYLLRLLRALGLQLLPPGPDAFMIYLLVTVFAF